MLYASPLACRYRSKRVLRAIIYLTNPTYFAILRAMKDPKTLLQAVQYFSDEQACIDAVAAMRWLLDTGRLGRHGALGTDTFGGDVGIDETFEVSTLLFHERRISLEVLANLERLPATGAWILVGGPINRRGSGSPASVFALIPPG